MINYNYQPESYFEGAGQSALLVKLTYPETQWGEEISLYANEIGGEIYYEAIDFYGNDFKLIPDKSAEPLSLQELIFMIETIVVDPDTEVGHAKSTLRGSPEVESNFYPDLKSYFLEKRDL